MNKENNIIDLTKSDNNKRKIIHNKTSKNKKRKINNNNNNDNNNNNNNIIVNSKPKLKIKQKQQLKVTTPSKKNNKNNVQLLIDSREVKLIKEFNILYDNKLKENNIIINKNLEYGDINIKVLGDNNKYNIECIIERKHVNDICSQYQHYLDQEAKLISFRESQENRISTILIVEGDFKKVRNYGNKTNLKYSVQEHIINLFTKTRIELKKTDNIVNSMEEIFKLFNLYIKKGSISKILINIIKHPPIHFTKSENNFTINVLKNVNGVSSVSAYNIFYKFGNLYSIIERIKKYGDTSMFVGIMKTEKLKIGKKLSIQIYNEIYQNCVIKNKNKNKNKK